MTMIDVPAPAITAPATPVAISEAAPPPAPAPVVTVDPNLKSGQTLVLEVDKFKPVEEPRKKGGRPPGAKNKPKTHDVITYEPSQTALPSVNFKSLTVSKGYTINVGAFSSVRFDISATAEGSDYATLEAALLEQVEASLEREASKYQAEIDAKTHASVAADKLVCK
jgi:hypothetical protein